MIVGSIPTKSATSNQKVRMATRKKDCPKHGETNHYLDGRSYWKCSKCNTEAVQRRRDNLKIMAVEYKGGKCEFCGYSKCIGALEFHHVDASQKEFGISSSGWTRSFEKMKVELDKCLILCANCHREIHSK